MSPDLVPAQTVLHARHGIGVILLVEDGFARVFFRDGGEQTVPVDALTPQQSWNEQVVQGIQLATNARLQRLRLATEAQALPLLAGAATLTGAKVELLPHQIVLTHRVAEASPRRFLIADDVGLGKTIETALILRELASRGELVRALMIVPAGLVENWRRELNDVFGLDFEVFGSDGDVTDRKTNAFARHHRLIASIDTLKRPARMARLEEAPPWDLVVFDEAHHLTAVRSGHSVKKTDNYRLAELLRTHSRDLLLLSATPHQGDHFRFLALVRLLEPTLFHNAEDMIENRHRLNAVVIRRTKADACRVDGSSLFARRQVHTQMFCLSPEERVFYDALTAYIQDGFDLAAVQGGKGRAIGFVMAVFQKIAASSFAAVRRTLERRLLALTLHEAVVRDGALDVSGRDRLLHEARQLLVSMHGLDDGPLGRAEADRLLADARVRLLKKLRTQADDDGSELTTADWEETAAFLVEYALPEERQRIRELLSLAPSTIETKLEELLRAMEQLWGENPSEKIIVFTTYLGGVDQLRTVIEDRFPDAGVEVLKGGDHGAKLAAERRFRRPNGPRVLLCTAAGREGINLQFARILFNHDLPWNPMDLEQRIGRIHRYGQQDTVQVYNLVAGDTIEGRVFLLLEEKIRGVATALGKVDERGEVSEDLRAQILGQLGERLSFTHLYQEALRDPTLQRTAAELEVALGNASKAREVVSQLFQDLEPFRLEDYRPTDDREAVNRLRDLVVDAVATKDGEAQPLSPSRLRIQMPGMAPVIFTVDRDEALAEDGLQLLGLEHPVVSGLLAEGVNLPAEERAVVRHAADRGGIQAVWAVAVHGSDSRRAASLLRVQLDEGGRISCGSYRPEPVPRVPIDTGEDGIPQRDRQHLVTELMPAAIKGYLVEAGLLHPGATYSSRLLAWVENVSS